MIHSLKRNEYNIFLLIDSSELLIKAKNLIMKKEKEEGEIAPGSPTAASIFTSSFTSPDVEDDTRSEKSYHGSGNVTVHNCQDYVNR